MKKHISILLPNLRGGGAERVTVNLVNGLIQRGFKVDIVLLSADGEFLNNLSPEVRVIDLKVKRMRGLLFPLIRYLFVERPSAMLACMWPLTSIAVLAIKLCFSNVRLIVVEHTTWSRDITCKSIFKRWWIAKLMHYTFPSANGIVAVSKGAADDLAQFAKISRSTITVIYNPVVGDDKINSSYPMHPLDWSVGKHFKILAVGTLAPIKDYSTLLNAVAQLRQKINARLLILGEGSCRAILEEDIKRLGLTNSVFMPGFTKDISAYYIQADLHVLSSLCEGLPTVIIEALASGTPVVSTDCPSGPREILSEGRFGQLVPVGDVSALAEAMAFSLNSTHDTPALKLRAQDFTINKAVSFYEEMLFPKI